MFSTLVTTPLTNFIIGFYQLFGENLGLAIIFFTIVLKLALLPLTIRQIRFQRKMAELQPKLQEMQSKKNGKKGAEAMSLEEMQLMKQTASGCAGGCLPFLIQIPILIGLNQVINRIATAESGDVFNDKLYFDFLKHDAEYAFHTRFLGFDLATVPSDIGFDPTLLPYAILIILLIFTQFIQSNLMTYYQRHTQKKKYKNKANQKKKSKEELEKEKMQEDMQKMMKMQMKYFLPLMIGIAAYSFTAALGLYWFTQSLFSIGQSVVQNNLRDGRKPYSMELFKAVTIHNKSEKEKTKEKAREAEYKDA